MPNTKEIASKVSDLIAAGFAAIADYELVRVQLTPGGRFLTLQVMAERKDRRPMTVNDCAKISHALSPQLDATGEVSGRYTLEVSSPGLERPLVRVQDFERFTGHEARIELAAPLGGDAGNQKRFQGSIVRVTGQAPNAEIALRTETGEVRVRANSIARAKLVLTDKLLDAKTDTKH